MKFSQHIGKGAWAIASRGLQFLPAVAYILVINALPVTEFGAFGVFQQLYIVLFTFSDNFALQAIVKHGVEPGVDLTELLSSTALLFAGFLLAAVGILVAFPDFFGELLNSPRLPDLMPWMALFVVANIPRTFVSKILQMRFHVREIFFIDLINFGLSAAAIVTLYTMDRLHSATDVIGVTVISGALSSLLALWLGRAEIFVRPRVSRTMARRVFDFGKYQSGTGIAASLMNSIDVFMVSKFTGPKGVGLYSAAKQLYKVYDIIRDTQTMFVFPASSKYYSRGEFGTLKAMIEKAVSLLYLLMIPLGAGLILLAPIIFDLLFGGKYDEAIPVFQILMTAALVLPMQMIFSTSMVGFGKMRQFFRVMIVSFLFNILVSLVLLLTIGVEGAAIGFVLALGMQALQFYSLIKREIHFDPRELFFRGWRDARAYLGSRF